MGATVNRVTLTIAALALVLSACGSEPEETVDALESDVEESPEIHRALRFSAPTTDGGEFDGETLADSTTVLWFWTAECSECVGQASVVSAADRAHDGVDFHGVVGRSDEEAVTSFEAAQGIDDMTNVIDEHGTIWGGFEVISPPSFVFLRPDGTHTTVPGAMTGDELNAAIAEELG
ncbi:redoxin domain-containing protein [Nocardiopsis sp. MG754419]|uniref:redoxin domain-containing protein n=1 Tax=Nocardiopsis sp. MG754419 TaxID=2259865 RepID=UPI001BAD0D80|nr:redoxin domain-containing protein [Nocardiopsis sp. MG754419]MBR8741023.1 thioredoxin family protein [Nocardiopsis sp. MG754419]